MLARKTTSIPLPLLPVLALAVIATTAWALPQTQDLKGEVVSANGAPVQDAVCTLTGQGLPAEGIPEVTGERGGLTSRACRQAGMTLRARPWVTCR